MISIREIVKKYNSKDFDYNIMALVLGLLATLSILLVVVHFIVRYPFVISIKWILVCVYSIFSLILVQNKYKMKYIKIITLLLLAFVLVPYSWFSVDGSNGILLQYSFILVIVIAMVLKGTKKAIFITLFIVEIEVLLIIEHMHPQLVQNFSDEITYTNKLLQTPIIIIFTTIIVSIVISMYIKQKKIIEVYNKKLQKLSSTDDLTKVKNRRSILTLFERLFIKAQKKEISLQILLIDIDNFKYINDTYGHQQGDAVIYEMCQIIEKVLGKDGVLGRYGGDEFLIIFEDIDYDKVYEYANQIKSSVSLEITEGFRFTISGGLVEYEDENNSKDMIYKADILLFEAKEMGKNIIRTKQVNYIQEQIKIPVENR